MVFKAKDGAEVHNRLVSLDNYTVVTAESIGGGNVSLGIRLAIKDFGKDVPIPNGYFKLSDSHIRLITRMAGRMNCNTERALQDILNEYSEIYPDR